MIYGVCEILSSSRLNFIIFWGGNVREVSNLIALAGGVGGAKLVLGLSKILSPEELSIVVNTGDDEDFYGLHVSPDLDTVMYTLAGLSNTETGW